MATQLSWLERSVHTRKVEGSNLSVATKIGPVVKWLRHRPFTAVSWVRIPSGSPQQKLPIYQVSREFYFFLLSQFFANHRKIADKLPISGFEPKGSRRKRCLLSRLCSKLVAFSLSLKFSLSHRKSHSLFRPLGALCSFPVGITTPKTPYLPSKQRVLFFLLSLSFLQTIVKLRTNCQYRDSNSKFCAANFVYFHSSF